jgi:serine protease inhibitor
VINARHLLPLCVVVVLIAGLATLPGQLRAAESEDKAAVHAVTANNDFAFALYQELADSASDKPLFFSPYAISSALLIAAEGARYLTAEEMGKVLCFPKVLRREGAGASSIPWDLDRMHSGMVAVNRQFEAVKRRNVAELKKELASLNKSSETTKRGVGKPTNRARELQWRISCLEKLSDLREQVAKFRGIVPSKLRKEMIELQAQLDCYEIRVSNALWGEKQFPFSQSYLDTIRKHYGPSCTFQVDFRNDVALVRKRINEFIEKHTDNRIKGSILPRTLSPDTTLVLTNAVYFKGGWSSCFDEKQTRDRPFQLADGKVVSVPTMYGYFGGDSNVSCGDFRFDTLEFEVVELPFRGTEMTMVVLVPRSPQRLPELEKELTNANLQTILGKLLPTETGVYLPKFEMSSSVDLRPALEALGMKRAFRDPRLGRGAQFDGTSDSADAPEKLYLRSVLHETFFEVDEKGGAAKLATGRSMTSERSAGVKKKLQPTLAPAEEFRVDKPFLFVIRDQRTGAILFLGRALNPQPRK